MERHSLKTNTVLNSIKTLTSILFPLITFPYISRVLLPENVGKINFGASIVAYFSLMASLGISTHAIRECSAVRDDKDRLGNVASQIFSINLITTIIAYAALVIALVLFPKLRDYRLLIIIQSMSIVATTFGADWINTALEDFRYITIRTVMFQVISLLLMFIFIHRPEDYIKYAIICVISSVGSNVLNIFYRKRYCSLRFIGDFVNGIEWKRHLKPVLLLFVMILAQSLFNNVDVTMLGIIKGDREVGIYSTAHKIMNLVNQVIASLCWVVLPRMSLYFEKQDYTEINKLLRKVLSFYFTLGFPCVVGIMMISKDIIILFAGSEYADASIVLQVLMIAFSFMLIGGNFWGNVILLPSRREKIFMGSCIISTVINISANCFMIPLLGATGAAMTTALSELILFLLLYFMKDKRIKITNLFRMLISPCIGCVAIVVICLLCSGIQILWLRTVLSVVISAGAYFAIQIATKNELTQDVLKAIRKIVLRRG